MKQELNLKVGFHSASDSLSIDFQSWSENFIQHTKLHFDLVGILILAMICKGKCSGYLVLFRLFWFQTLERLHKINGSLPLLSK